MQHLKLTLPSAPRSYRLPSSSRQRGMTLIELMISITIGLIMLAALTALIVQQSSIQAELEKSSRQIENGRYAMHLLNEDIQMAGYYGEFSGAIGVPGALPDPCLTTTSELEAAMAFPVQGYDFPNASTVRPSCIAAANHVAGTDILVVRRANNTDTTSNPNGVLTDDIKAGQTYIQIGIKDQALTFKVAQAVTNKTVPVAFDLKQKDGVAAGKIRNYLVHIYFISPCSVMANTTTCASTDDGGKPIPTLKMRELSASGGITPLVEGIENMQIDYGIDTSGDGSPDGQFVATPPAVAGWANAVALRVHLLARNTEPSAGYVDSKTYAMGYNSAGAVQTVAPVTDFYGDNVRPYKRHVFSQLIRVVNPSSRRDQ